MDIYNIKDNWIFGWIT